MCRRPSAIEYLVIRWTTVPLTALCLIAALQCSSYRYTRNTASDRDVAILALTAVCINVVLIDVLRAVGPF